MQVRTYCSKRSPMNGIAVIGKKNMASVAPENVSADTGPADAAPAGSGPADAAGVDAPDDE